MLRRSVIPESCAGLDFEKAAKELIAQRGNISAAAAVLGVPKHDLRVLTLSVPRLINAAFEAEEQALDEAESTLRAALKSSDAARRLQAAVYILKTNPAAKRRLG
jgi:hypothetical protein